MPPILAQDCCSWLLSITMSHHSRGGLFVAPAGNLLHGRYDAATWECCHLLFFQPSFVCVTPPGAPDMHATQDVCRPSFLVCGSMTAQAFGCHAWPWVVHFCLHNRGSVWVLYECRVLVVVCLNITGPVCCCCLRHGTAHGCLCTFGPLWGQHGLLVLHNTGHCVGCGSCLLLS